MDSSSNARASFSFERSIFVDPTWMLANTDRHIRSIAPWEVKIHDEPITSETEIEVLCTYSWSIESGIDNHIIYVPGFPRTWSPPQLPIQIPTDFYTSADSDFHCLCAQQQFEPVFQALHTMNPNTNFSSIDIITSRNSLRYLLKFVSGERSHEFCLGLHIVGKTLILGRKESPVKRKHSGFGYSFEEKFTTATEKMADTHYRAIRYRFGSLNMVVRHETDAFCESSSTGFKELFRGNNTPGNPQAPIQVPIRHETATAVYPRGFYTPQQQVAELKTSVRDDTVRQCWFGRTPNLCVASQEKGLVTKAEMKDVWGECAQWEKTQQMNLRRLAGLLEQIKGAVEGLENGRGILMRKEREAPLQIFGGKSGMGDALPLEVVSQFWQ